MAEFLHKECLEPNSVRSRLVPNPMTEGRWKGGKEDIEERIGGETEKEEREVWG